jgi:UDPglucose--hexose-1-phosphate uridylyltransferase
MRHWYDVPGVEYVVAFKNVGAAAGASLRHTHSQLIATSLLPPAMAEIGRRVGQHFRRYQKCLLCEMLQGEFERGERIVMETERFVVFCPFASRLPYLVRIAPREHSDRFELACPASLHELSGVAQKCLNAMESMFSSCAYNFTLHTRPRRVASAASFHWWMEIFPRLTKVAGFEWGSDCYINPVTPELAAKQLREAIKATQALRAAE